MRTAVTTLNKPVTCPEFHVPDAIPPIRVPGRAVFLDPALTARDKFYRFVEDPTDVSITRWDLITREPISTVFLRPANPVPLPLPSAFTEEDEMLAALAKWYSQISAYFAGVYLPLSISIDYHVPTSPKVFTEKEKASSTRYRTFQPQLWPLFPVNYMTMLDLLSDTSEPFDPETEFQVQIPRRDPILYRHHITSDPQWQAQFLMVEPIKELYDTLEDFETGYDNWYAATLNELRDPLFLSDQFAHLLGLDVIRPYLLADEEMDIPAEFESDERFAWVSQITNPPTGLDAIAECLQDCSPVARQCECAPLEVLQVFGTEKASHDFVMEMSELGHTRYDLLRPNHPTGFILKTEESSTDVVAGLKTAELSVPGLFRHFLNYDIKREHVASLMHFQIAQIRVIDFLSQNLTLEKLSMVCQWQSANPHQPTRLARVLRGIFGWAPTADLIRPYFEAENVCDFHRLVSILNRTQTYRIPLVPLPDHTDPTLNGITRLYLLTCFLSCMSDFPDSRCAWECARELRPLGFQVARSLQAQGLMDRLRREVPGAVLMLLRCGSEQIHRIVLGSKFLVWVNEHSTTRIGQVLMQAVMHGPAIEAAAALWLRNGPDLLKECIGTMTSSCSPVVCGIIDFIRMRSSEARLKLRGQAFLTALELVNATKKETAATIMVHISELLERTDLIGNFTDRTFQLLLAGAVVKICREVAPQESALSRSQLMSLSHLSLGRNEMCFAITQQPGFLEVLAAHLLDKHVSNCERSWDLLCQITKWEDVQVIVLKNNKIKETLRNIPSSTHRYGLIRLLQFGLWVFVEAHPPTKKMFCDMLSPEMSRLAYLYAGRNVIYGNDQVMAIALEKFCGKFKRSKWSQIWEKDGTEDFAAAFKKQLEIALASLGLEGQRWKKYTGPT